VTYWRTRSPTRSRSSWSGIEKSERSTAFGEFAGQEPGAIGKSWSLSYQAYLGMVNTVGIDRVIFTADHHTAA
jgi:hypothetical protein